MTKRTALFGGSFDPPTRAHEQIISACLARTDLDEVWVMPSGSRSDKMIETNDVDRLAMLAVLKQTEFTDSSRLNISDYELRLPRPTQTIHTMEALTLSHPTTDFWFVCGADTYNNMSTWHGGGTLLQLLSFLVVPREGWSLPPESLSVQHLQFDEPQLKRCSSTEVRTAAQAGRPLHRLVCQAVQHYIVQRNLYGVA